MVFIIGIYVYKTGTCYFTGRSGSIRSAYFRKKFRDVSKHFMAEEGSSIQAGDTLVIIDSPELNAKLDQATSAENAALAQNKKAKQRSTEGIDLGAYEMWQKSLVGVDITKNRSTGYNACTTKVFCLHKRERTEALSYKAAVATANAAKSQYDMALNGAELEDKEAFGFGAGRAKGAVKEGESYLQETTLLAN